MQDSRPTPKSTLSMRKRNEALTVNGWRSSSIAFSPQSLAVLEDVKIRFDLKSREAAVNAVLERIGENMFLRQELLAVTP